MGRGKAWTKKEDARLQAVAQENRDAGISYLGGYDARKARCRVARLKDLAAEMGRSYQAVLSRASKCGYQSFSPRGTRKRMSKKERARRKRENSD